MLDEGDLSSWVDISFLYQLALATFKLQQMFIEPEFEVIPLAFSVRSQWNFHLMPQR